MYNKSNTIKRDGSCSLRQTAEILLTVTWLLSILIWMSPVAKAAAPIHRRFEVRKTSGGYAILGFRASTKRTDRFVIAVGTSARAARRQMLSVRWDAARGLTDPKARCLMAARKRRGGAIETITVLLDREGRWVRSVVYTVSPARFSRKGLGWFLKSAYGKGRTLRDSRQRVLVAYGPRKGAVLHVEALPVRNYKSRWHMVYRIDAVAKPAIFAKSSAGTSARRS